MIWCWSEPRCPESLVIKRWMCKGEGGTWVRMYLLPGGRQEEASFNQKKKGEKVILKKGSFYVIPMILLYFYLNFNSIFYLFYFSILLFNLYYLFYFSLPCIPPFPLPPPLTTLPTVITALLSMSMSSFCFLLFDPSTPPNPIQNCELSMYKSI